MYHTAFGIQNGFMHALRNGRMREDCVSEILLGQLTLARDNIALDQFGDFCADHVRAEQFPGLLVEDGFYEAFRGAHCYGLAIADEGEAANLDIVAFFLCGFFSQTDAGDLRVRVSAAWNVPGIKGSA